MQSRGELAAVFYKGDETLARFSTKGNDGARRGRETKAATPQCNAWNATRGQASVLAVASLRLHLHPHPHPHPHLHPHLALVLTIHNSRFTVRRKNAPASDERVLD